MTEQIPEPHPKVKAVVYSSEGVSVRYGDEITEDEKQTVKDAFEGGERDPGKLRELI